MKKRIVLKPLKKKSKKRLSTKKSLSIIIFCLILNFSLISFVIIPSYSLEEKNNINDNQEVTPNVEVIVNYKENLTIPFLSEYKISDFIEYINGEIIDDYLIDTSKLGTNKISFDYINTQNIKVTTFFELNIIDDIPPVIWLGETKTVTTDYEGDLLDDIVCADNIDDNPKCKIIGYYDTEKVGKYELTFKATDKSGNETIKEFTLNVKEPSEKKNSPSSTSNKTKFNNVVKKYKTSQTKIGIDVSSWQGDIDYEAVKNAGVEFVFIRVGSTRGINGEYFVDKKFKRNIEGFNKVGIPVGIYFYSYANSKESAIKDANWVIEQIKDYKVELPVVYDWESWSFYNEFNQSFYSLTKSAQAYLDTISNAGYQGMLYSSKNYLEKVWYNTGYDVWLAHYTDQTSYKGDYSYWQLCSNGKVDGISGNVDINIYYEK